MENEFTKAVDHASNAASIGGDVARAGIDHIAKFDAPGRAREYVQKTADLAKESAVDLSAKAANITQALEGRMVDVIGEAAKFGRDWQTAIFKDAEAIWTHVGKLASAKNVAEAMDAQNAFVQERSDTLTARARTANDYLSKVMTEGADAVKDNMTKVQSMSHAA